MVLPVKEAKRNLEQLLEELDLGQTLTLLGSEGAPVAVVVSVKPTRPAAEPVDDWEVRWRRLAEDVGRAWQGDKSAVEVIAEMRR
jgi:antitoxin (DNA-binding transcriptional repressor) of toxin-antitoxin stability system